MGILVILLTVISIISPTTSYAAFPGENGKIAFTCYPDGNFDICVMNADGSGLINLTNDPAYDSTPAWSPDGAKIAFESYRNESWDIYVMNADGSDLTNLTNSSAAAEFNPAWLPDGTKIAFARSFDSGGGHANLWVMNADGTAQIQLTNLVGHFPSAFHPDWSPDGTKIAFCQSLSDTHQEIYLVNSDGSGLTQVTNNGIISAWPSWSPDGTRIAFMRGPAGSSDVYVMKPDGSDQTYLTNQAVHPSWSPDGTKIAFSSYRDGNYEIYVMNSDGTGPINLTNSPENESSPAWQPLPVPVTIDIKPGSFPNSINPRSKGKIPVAILTDGSFDATTVDPLTLTFGATGTEALPVHYAFEDVDGNGTTDMILHFNTQDTGIVCGATSAFLTGKTISGQAIKGSDSISTVGCK